ncbi:MAG: hypothetical protein J7639_25000 [Paenibacillaceae bacterium]|nr:hypothetical protein [Paenibacillaceae bacterium]
MRAANGLPGWPGAIAVVTVLAGCSGGKEEAGKGASPSPAASAATGATAAPSAAPNPYAQKLELSWIGFNQTGKANDKLDSPTKKLIEEKFNVKINQVMLDMSNKEQVNLYFAEGKTADYISLNVPYQFLIDQGLLKELSEEKIRSAMPKWMERVDAMLGKDVASTTMKYKGKNYFIPFLSYAQLQPWVMALRKDWLDNVGIAKLPETMDEYHEVLKRFTFNDPDKNGKNDTFGGHGIQLYLRGAYGLGSSNTAFYADKSGKVSPVALSDGFRDYLKTMQAWNQEGLIDPESLTDQRPQQRAKWESGKFGVLADHPWWFALSTAANLTSMVTNKNAAAKIEFIKPFTGKAGDKGAGGINFPSAGFGFAFGKNTSDDKVARIMAIKEFLVADDDFYKRVYYGEQGKGYTLDKDGIIQLTPEYSKVDKINEEGIAQYFGLTPVTWDYAKKNLVTKADSPAYDVSMSSPIKYTNVNFSFSGTNESLVKYGTAITTVATEFETNAVTGKLDIDKEWEAFKKKFLDAGGQAVLDEYQKLYDAANKK